MKVIENGYNEVYETCDKCTSVLLVNKADIEMEGGYSDSWPYNYVCSSFFICPVCGRKNFVSSEKVKKEYEKPKVRIRNK